MKVKVYAPAVLDAVAESLTATYWYKNDLKSFLRRVGVPDDLVSHLPWEAYKREIIRTLLDSLSTGGASGFTAEAVESAAAGGRILVVLMDGQDLVRILQGFDDLVDVLKRKLRHAAEQGRPLYRMGE